MKKYNYSDAIAAAVEQILTEDKQGFDFNEDLGVFSFDIRVSGKIQRFRYIIDINEDDIGVYGMCPIAADSDDKKMMAQMAEFFCRANRGLRNGTFELDYEDGDIRLRSFIDCEGSLPGPEALKNCLRCTAALYRYYGSGIAAIIFAGSTATEAIALCEAEHEEKCRRIRAKLDPTFPDTDPDPDPDTDPDPYPDPDPYTPPICNTPSSDDALDPFFNLFCGNISEDEDA